MIDELKKKYDNVEIRTVRGTATEPILYISKELKELGLQRGDAVAVCSNKNTIVIVPLK